MIGTVVVNGMTFGIEVVGTSEVQNINGAREIHLSIAPVFLGGGPDGGEEIPVAA